MSKLKSLEQLQAIRQKSVANTNMRVTGENPDRIVISIGMATCGIAAGARAVMTTLTEEIKANNLENISVVATGCLGYCYGEPLVVVDIPDKESVRYANVTAEIAKQIVSEHLMQGKILQEHILGKNGAKNE